MVSFNAQGPAGEGPIKSTPASTGPSAGVPCPSCPSPAAETDDDFGAKECPPTARPQWLCRSGPVKENGRLRQVQATTEECPQPLRRRQRMSANPQFFTRSC